MNAEKKLSTYEPVKVIIGILKNTDKIGSVICVDKQSILTGAKQFDKFRVWKLVEEDAEFYVEKLKDNQ